MRIAIKPDANAPRRMAIYTIGFTLLTVVLLARILWEQDDLIWADFVAFWSAARLVVSGDLSTVYDVAAQAAYQTSGQTTAPFFYPPTFLLLCIPLGLLSLKTALYAFMSFTTIAYIWATRCVGKFAWIPALAFPATAFNFIAGQNGMLTGALVGGGLTLLDRRPRTAGMPLGAMIIKPHLAIIIPIALLLSRRWQVLAYAAVSGALISLITVLLLGWHVWYDFFTVATHTARFILEAGKLPFFKIISVFGFSMTEGASLPFAYAAQAISAAPVIAAFVWLQWKRPSAAVERSAIVVAGLLLPPYVLQYDLVVMAFPCLWLAMQWIERQKIPTVEGLLVIMTFLSPVIGIFLLGTFPIFLLMRFVWLFYLLYATMFPANRVQAHFHPSDDPRSGGVLALSPTPDVTNWGSQRGRQRLLNRVVDGLACYWRSA